jgi:hypothetical protein
MTLEFNDGTKIEVITIFGGPRLCQGHMRDVLTFEISPTSNTFDNLRKLFIDNRKTKLMYTYTNWTDEHNTSGTTKNLIGESYSMLVSITLERRQVPVPPGKLMPVTMEDVFIVRMAQLTVEEYDESELFIHPPAPGT